MKKWISKLVPRLIGFYFNYFSFISPNRAASKSFALFCTPRKGQVLKTQKSFLEDAKDNIITVENNRIQTYRWKGSGPTILLMHGWESNTFRWRALIPILQKVNYNIIAMDAPAHGYSSGTKFNVPLYSACAQQVINEYKPSLVIGHSLGGMTLIYNLFKYTKENTLITKVVTLGSPSELSDFMKQYKNILGLTNRMMHYLELHFMAKFGFRFAEFSTSKFVKNIDKKGLLIHDKLDKIAPYWSSEQVHANWKNSSLISTTGLGHSLHQDKVREQIVTFLQT